MRATIISVFLTISVSQGLAGGFPPLAASFQDQGPRIIEQDQGGPYVIETLDKNRKKKEGEIRELIWNHWRQKRGRLVATWYSKEGVPSETTFVVEEGRQGTKSLKVTINCPTLKGTTAEHTEYRAYVVKRIALRHGAQAPNVVIPENEKESGERYRLVFYNEKQKEIGGV